MGNVLNFIFRVDGNAEIGMGHIIRSIALAHTLKNRGHQILFVSKESTGVEKIKDAGFECIKIKNKEEFIQLLQSRITDVIVIDLRYPSKEYLEKIKKLSDSLFVLIDVNDSLKYLGFSDLRRSRIRWLSLLQ